MSGSIRFENHLTLQEHAAAMLKAIPGALVEGAQIILDDAKTKVPVAPKKGGDKEPHLADTARINESRGGENTVGIEFASIYARYVHEHLGFKHIYGGQAKFLEAAMIEKQDDAINKVARELREHT